MFIYVWLFSIMDNQIFNGISILDFKLYLTGILLSSFNIGMIIIMQY